MEFIAPKQPEEVLDLLNHWKGKARLLAGGTNVCPDLRSGIPEASLLIDLTRVRSLSYIREERQSIRIGSMTSLAALLSSKLIKAKTVMLWEASRLLGNPLVRNRATIGGNLADASPAADLAVPLLALDAEVVIAKKHAKQRRVPIDQFFLGPNKTVLKKDELIEEVCFHKPTTGAITAYQKLGLRNAMAISVISMATLIEIEKDVCRKARIAVGAAAPVPMRAYNVEKVLTGKAITEAVRQRCCCGIADEVKPISDIRASAEYRRAMARVLLGQLLRKVTTEEQ
jgi:carbon-monoxide dehydrogenase medium subunit